MAWKEKKKGSKQTPKLKRQSKRETLNLRASVICVPVVLEISTVLNHRIIAIVLEDCLMMLSVYHLKCMHPTCKKGQCLLPPRLEVPRCSLACCSELSSHVELLAQSLLLGMTLPCIVPKSIKGQAHENTLWFL